MEKIGGTLKILVKSQFVLFEPLRTMSVAVSTRPVVPELSCIKLEVKDGVVSYFATTGFLSLYIPINSDDIEVVEPGSVLVNYDLFVAALSSIEGPISLYTTDKNLMVSSVENKKVSRRMPLAIIDNLPKPAVISGTTRTISAENLRDIINHVSFAAIKDGSRPELRGAYIGDMSMCGDGSRLACYTLGTDIDMTMSAEAISALQQVMPEDGDVQLNIDNWVSVKFADGTELCFAGTTDVFPESAKSIVEALSSKVASAVINVTTKSITRVFGGVSVYTEKAIKFGIAYIELKGESGHVYVKTEVPSVGMFEDELDCAYIGDDFNVLVSPQHIMDLVDVAKTENIEIRIFSSLDPLLVSDPTNDGWKVVQSVMANSRPQEVVDNDDF